MTDDSPESLPTAESWDNYWHGAQHGAAFSSGGTSHPLVLSFWDAFFNTVKSQYDQPKIVDIASGNGAVVACAESAFDGSLGDFTCLDISDSAISMLAQRHTGVRGVVADAKAIPLASASYDVATSQFGIEYAGLEAIDEVARLVAPGGQLALLLHHAGGGIYKQCAASRNAIEKMQASRFIPGSIRMLEKGFAACRGADTAVYEAAGRELVPAVQAMESIMLQHGKHVADGTIARLYNDVKTINSRIQHYEPLEVLDWLKRMQGEVEAFLGRMVSMCNAAIDEKEFEQLQEKLREGGFDMRRNSALADRDKPVPLAWALIAKKT